MDKKVQVRFKHWKSDVVLTRIGTLVESINPASDLILLKLDNGKYEDIRKETIVSVQKI